MAKYGTFKYGTGVKYGGTLGVVNLFKANTADPDYAVSPRHIKLTLKHSTGSIWNIDTVRLTYASKAHVIPKYLMAVDRRIKRTKVTLKYSTDEMWAVDSIRLKQRIVNRGPDK